MEIIVYHITTNNIEMLSKAIRESFGNLDLKIFDLGRNNYFFKISTSKNKTKEISGCNNIDVFETFFKKTMARYIESCNMLNKFDKDE